MTIKYTCSTCQVVMKIKDEKAGTDAKCPKCKTAFVVPSPDEPDDLELELELESDDDDDESPAAAKSKPEQKSVDADDERPRPKVNRLPKVRLPEPDPDDDDSDEATDSDDDLLALPPEKPRMSDDDRPRPRTSPLPKVRLPEPEPEAAAVKSATDSADDDDIDEPIELTPSTMRDDDDFDPMDVLSAKAKPTPRNPSSKKDSGDRKASVADMMRDFSAPAAREPGPAADVARPYVSSPQQTSGTAADALARAYQAKRDNAANPKPKKKEANLERELMIGWLKKMAPGLVVVLALAYGLYSWMMSATYTGPPLAQVTGIVTRSEKPAAGFRVCLVPIISEQETTVSGRDNEGPGKSTATGYTDEEGRFTMMYTAEIPGAALGRHNVNVYDVSGVPVAIPDDFLEFTVDGDKKNELSIRLY